MKRPVIDLKSFERTSNDKVDSILNGHLFMYEGQVVKDFNGNKYLYSSYYLGDNEFSFYLVGCENDDPCRIAYEFGELSKEDFWSRFGYIWKLHPTLTGIYDAERINPSQTCSTTKFYWDLVSLPPIELTRRRFENALATTDQSSAHSQNILKHYPSFLDAVEIRKQQWQEIKKMTA